MCGFRDPGNRQQAVAYTFICTYLHIFSIKSLKLNMYTYIHMYFYTKFAFFFLFSLFVFIEIWWLIAPQINFVSLFALKFVVSRSRQIHQFTKAMTWRTNVLDKRMYVEYDHCDLWARWDDSFQAMLIQILLQLLQFWPIILDLIKL